MGFLDAFFARPQKINTNFSGLESMAKEYTNPFSSTNKSVLQGLTNQATDIIGQQGFMNNQARAMGINPFADIQNKQLTSTVVKNAGGGWNEWIRNAQGIGTGLMTNKAQLEFQKDQANAELQQLSNMQQSKFLQQLLGQFVASPLPAQGLKAGYNFLSGMFGG